MDLLEFARGPALQFSFYVLVAGVLWRFLGIVLLQTKPDYSEPRQAGGIKGAIQVIVTRSFSAKAFSKATKYPKTVAYTLHIGLFVIIFFFVPHIVFFRDLTGLNWPGLPNNIIYVVGVVSVASGIALFIRRVTNPVLRLISNFDDYFSLFATLLPIVTGLIMPIRFGVRFETLLAVHILSVCMLLIWLPFGKLAHTFQVFLARGTTGALLVRRGAKT